jgi:hypothetical protein
MDSSMIAHSSDKPRRPEQQSEKQVEGAVDAAHHLGSVGLLPAFNLPTLRAMWRAGHRRLAEKLRGER